MGIPDLTPLPLTTDSYTSKEISELSRQFFNYLKLDTVITMFDLVTPIDTLSNDDLK